MVVFDVFADDVGPKDRVTDVMLGLEGLHERGIVKIEDVFADFGDTGEIGGVLLGGLGLRG